MTQETLVYISQNEGLTVQVPLEQETVRLNRQQMSLLFDRDIKTIGKHINNIFKEQELEEKATVAKFATVQKEGDRTVERNIEHYNLDVIISVGYRVKSQEGVRFRQRATQTLRSHIIDGYTFNPKRIQEKYGTETLTEIQTLQQKFENTNLALEDILAVTKAFDLTRTSLDAYDKSSLPTTGYTQETLSLEVAKLYHDIETFKSFLIEKDQATELFAQEKSHGSLEGIFGNIFQSAFSEDVYPTIEEKAANLLYFIVKNHPFNDGNKRTGAFSFIRFLTKAGYHFQNKISPETLTALTLLIAQSPADDKANIIGLIILLLK